MSVVGARIKERRTALALSQEQLAERIPTSQKQISRYESGVNDPTGDVIAALARSLNTSTDYLLGVTNDPTPSDQRNNLAPRERDLLAALRRGDKLQAIAIITGGST